MGKFTDRSFGFPIKIYDGFSLKRAMEIEDNTSEQQEADWVSGTFKLPCSELEDLSWHDGFSRGRSVEDVVAEGFDLTIVFSPIHGELTCTWPRKEFEARLNAFVDKLEKDGKGSKDLVI